MQLFDVEFKGQSKVSLCANNINTSLCKKKKKLPHPSVSRSHSLLIKHSICNQLLNCSRCRKRNSFAPVEKNFLFVVGMPSPAPSHAAWRETHLALKYPCGEWKNGRDACRGHSFFFPLPCQTEKTLAQLTAARMTFSAQRYLYILKLMPCLK